MFIHSEVGLIIPAKYTAEKEETKTAEKLNGEPLNTHFQFGFVNEDILRKKVVFDIEVRMISYFCLQLSLLILRIQKPKSPPSPL